MGNAFRLELPTGDLPTRYVHHGGQLFRVLEVPYADWPALPVGCLLFAVVLPPGRKRACNGYTVAGHLAKNAGPEKLLSLALDRDTPDLALSYAALGALLFPVAAGEPAPTW